MNGGVLSADEAVARLVARARPLGTQRVLPLSQALGRVLACDVTAGLDNPAYDNSAMDGYGVRLADCRAAGETTLPVGGRSAAGDAPGATLPVGQAVRIFTGAPVPLGVDAVLPQEACRADQGTVTLSRPRPGENIRKRGEDFQQGQVVLRAGTVLRPPELALAAALGLAGIAVFDRPKVAYFSTGNEVCAPGQPLPPGGIYDSNRFALQALVQQMGCDGVDLGHLPDNLADITAALRAAEHQADVILTSGGVSVGDEDHVKNAVQAVGEIDFWRVAIRPGRPVAFGRVGQTPFLGLPGNPVSGMVCFMIFARPFLARLAGRSGAPLVHTLLPARFGFRKKPGRREWLRGWVQEGQVMSFPQQGSNLLTSMVAATGLIDVDEHSEGFAPGDLVRFISFADLWA